jgi:hypothetical protein
MHTHIKHRCEYETKKWIYGRKRKWSIAETHKRELKQTHKIWKRNILYLRHYHHSKIFNIHDILYAKRSGVEETKEKNDKKITSWKYHEVGDLFPSDEADKEC